MGEVDSLREIRRFEEILAARLGIHREALSRCQIEAALVERVGATRAANARAYLERLADPAASRGELRALAPLLTVGETYFGRGADHFRAFVEHVLPERLRATGRGRKLRILSAGCSSGEEPYTVAMLLGDLDLECEVEIVGIDVNPANLAKAARARFGSWALRDLDGASRSRHFVERNGELVLRPEIRERVRFEERNLLEEDAAFWRPGSFDVIFCRNVLIYFTPEAVKDVVARFARALVPGGFLFLGHSETLRGVSQAFQTISGEDTFYYQVGEAPVPVAKPALARRPAAPVAARPAAAPAWPPRPAAPPPQPPPPTLGDALDLIRHERYAEAEVALRALPDDADTLIALASVLHNLGSAAEAGRVCRELRRRDVANPDVRYLEALGHEQSGDHAAAADRALDATRLDPSFAMPHMLLGRASRRRGDLETARRAYTRALDLLLHEHPRRLLLHAGGFSRDAVRQLCRTELTRCAKGRT